jgi:hypothetical protein
MTRAQEYLRRAEAAEAAALVVEFPDIKEQLLAVAQQWRVLAANAGSGAHESA